MLHGAGSYFPVSVPDVELAGGNTLRKFLVGDLTVPLVAFDQGSHMECNLGVGDDGFPDETGRALWPSSTLVASLLLRCRQLLSSTHVLELGSGNGFCGLVARQLARRVVLSDREPLMRRLARRNLQLQRSLQAAPTSIASYGWAEGDKWPTEQFGLIVASDVLYGTHQSMRTEPEELVRFVNLLEQSLSPGGMVIIGHVERNCMARADLCAALELRFIVRLLHAKECVTESMLIQSGNEGLLGSSALLCVRVNEGAELIAAATVLQASGVAQSFALPPQPLSSVLLPPPPPQPSPSTLPPPVTLVVESGVSWPVQHEAPYRGAQLLPQGPSGKDCYMADSCNLDVHRLLWLERTIASGHAPHNARELLGAELRGYYIDETDRWAATQPSRCLYMYELPRDGKGIREKNMAYTTQSHRRMCEDIIRTRAYQNAIRHAVGRLPVSARVLDVGSGPLMLLGRMALQAGAPYVACVEHSEMSIDLAIDIARRESHSFDWRVRPMETQCAAAQERGNWSAPSTRAAQMTADQLRDVDLFHELVCRLSLHVQPTQLSFCAVGAVATASAPDRQRDCVAADGRLRPLMQVEMAAAWMPRKGQRRTYSESVRETAGTGTQILELYRGLSSDIMLPSGIDLIIHEILGNIASAEGVIHAINELHDRAGLTSRSCRMVPSAAGTMVVPTMMLDLCVVERLLLYEKSGCCAAKPRTLYASRGFPSNYFLSTPQPFEWLDFERHLPYKSSRLCSFITCRPGFFDGLHMHLVVDTDAANCIDVYRERTTWTCTYMRLLDEADAIWLPAGSVIECVCNVNASSHYPAYSVQVRTSSSRGAPQRQVAEFSWRGDG